MLLLPENFILPDFDIVSFVQSWTYFPAFLATLLSVTGLTYLAWQEHVPENPRTLSIMAAGKPQTLRYFRVVLWVCGTLFAVTMYLYLIPRISYGFPQAIAWSLTYVSEILLAILPATGNTLRTHNILSLGMGAGMLGSAVLFTRSFQGGAAIVEATIVSMMIVLGALTFLDKKRFIFYELPYIYLAHISIIVALTAL